MQNKLISQFFDLVQIDSPTGEEENVRTYIANFLKDHNVASQVDRHGNLFAKIEGIGKPLLLSAHMDTVEPGRGVKPSLTSDGYIVSDGTTILGGDNKIGIAVILNSIDAIGTTPHRPLELLFTVSEEAGISGANRFDYTKLKSTEGYCFDLTQPLGIIVTASTFYERFEITMQSKSAHASRPHLGLNILPALSMLLSQLSYGKINKDTFFNIGVIHAGDSINTVPGTVRISGEIRAFTKEALDTTINFCKQVCVRIEKEFGITIETSWFLENPGYTHTSEKAKEFIKKTISAIEHVGLTPAYQEGGVSDANEFNAHGVLSLELSTGGENAHTREERIAVSSLNKLAELVIELIKP